MIELKIKLSDEDYKSFEAEMFKFGIDTDVNVFASKIIKAHIKSHEKFTKMTVPEMMNLTNILMKNATMKDVVEKLKEDLDKDVKDKNPKYD